MHLVIVFIFELFLVFHPSSLLALAWHPLKVKVPWLLCEIHLPDGHLVAPLEQAQQEGPLVEQLLGQDL